MARLFGLIGNRAELSGRVLAVEQDILRVVSASGQLGWGIGFYQGGEVLMRRRPIDDRPTIDPASAASDVRADLLVGHVRSATIGALRTENTHPFRYRQWLFAMTGTLPAFETIRERLLASVPEFLRSSVRGETDAELLFYVFLSFAHDAGRLHDASISPGHVADALRSSLSVVESMAAEVGGGPAKVNLMLSDGERIYALRRGAAMAHRVLSGRADAEALIGDDLNLRRRTPELGQTHFSLVVGDVDDDAMLVPSEAASRSRWTLVPEGACLMFERTSQPVVL